MESSAKYGEEHTEDINENSSYQQIGEELLPVVRTMKEVLYKSNGWDGENV